MSNVRDDVASRLQSAAGSVAWQRARGQGRNWHSDGRENSSKHDVPFKDGSRNCLRANVALVACDVRSPSWRDGADDVGSEGSRAAKKIQSPANRRTDAKKGGCGLCGKNYRYKYRLLGEVTGGSDRLDSGVRQ